MFHDPKLDEVAAAIGELELFQRLSFQLNAQAGRLYWIVRHYRQQGVRTLPVRLIKKAYFTPRQWELATKGTRIRGGETGRELVNPDQLAPDGLQSTGIISEVRKRSEESDKNGKYRIQTYWVIGEFDETAHEEIVAAQADLAAWRVESEAERLENSEAQPEPDEHEPNVRTSGCDVGENLTPREQKLSDEGYELGYEVATAVSRQKLTALEKRLRSCGCVFDAPLNNKLKGDAENTIPLSEVEPFLQRIPKLEHEVRRLLVANSSLSVEKLALQDALSEQTLRAEFDAIFDQG